MDLRSPLGINNSLFHTQPYAAAAAALSVPKLSLYSQLIFSTLKLNGKQGEEQQIYSASATTIHGIKNNYQLLQQIKSFISFVSQQAK